MQSTTGALAQLCQLVVTTKCGFAVRSWEDGEAHFAFHVNGRPCLHHTAQTVVSEDLQTMRWEPLFVCVCVLCCAGLWLLHSSTGASQPKQVCSGSLLFPKQQNWLNQLTQLEDVRGMKRITISGDNILCKCVLHLRLPSSLWASCFTGCQIAFGWPKGNVFVVEFGIGQLHSKLPYGSFLVLS